MKTRISTFNTLKQFGELSKVKIYIGNAVELDPYEKNTESRYTSCITIEALVKDLSISTLVYQFYGNIPNGSKQIITDIKYTNLFKIARKIEIDGSSYMTWKDSAKGFSIITKRDYIIVVASLNDEKHNV